MALAAETMVRMGELAASSSPGDVLVSLGLGSCIGLALLDPRGVAGLAHIVLPDAEGHAVGDAGKFADRAVPQLIEDVLALGARPTKLEAVLVGGASMFAVKAATLEVGQRNEAAVRELLERKRIPVRAAATGGGRGRTVRVDVASATVTVREAGGRDEILYSAEEAMAA